MEAMLLQSARLGLAIRKEYTRLKTDPLAKYYTYVLQLQDGRFYVGNTDNIFTRLMDHKQMNASSALWVRHHGPIQRIVEITRNSSKYDELYKTLLYMSMFGWDNVRGSSYCKLHMMRPPDCLHTFARTRDGEFEYLSREEIDHVARALDELRGMES